MIQQLLYESVSFLFVFTTDAGIVDKDLEDHTRLGEKAGIMIALSESKFVHKHFEEMLVTQTRGKLCSVETLLQPKTQAGNAGDGDAR